MTLRRTMATTAIAVVALVAMGWGPGSKAEDKKVYKWVDEKGVVHYGDSVPPQYSQSEREILNQRGVEIGRLEAQKTDAQRAQEAAKLQAAENAKQRDQVLLATYLSVDQIEQLRDQRLDLIEGQVKVTGQYLDTLRGRLKNLQIQARGYKPYSDKAGAGPM